MEIQNNNQKYVAPTITKKKWKKERDVNLEKNLAQTKENRNKRTSKFQKKLVKEIQLKMGDITMKK